MVRDSIAVQKKKVRFMSLQAFIAEHIKTARGDANALRPSLAQLTAAYEYLGYIDPAKLGLPADAVFEC